MILTPSSNVRFFNSARYYAREEEEMADTWDEMRRKIDDQLAKMDLEGNGGIERASTNYEENAAMKREIDDALVFICITLKTKLTAIIKPTANNLYESESPLDTEELEDLAGTIALLRYLKKMETTLCLAYANTERAWQGQSTYPATMQALT